MLLSRRSTPGTYPGAILCKILCSVKPWFEIFCGEFSFSTLQYFHKNWWSAPQAVSEKECMCKLYYVCECMWNVYLSVGGSMKMLQKLKFLKLCKCIYSRNLGRQKKMFWLAVEAGFRYKLLVLNVPPLASDTSPAFSWSPWSFNPHFFPMLAGILFAAVCGVLLIVCNGPISIYLHTFLKWWLWYCKPCSVTSSGKLGCKLKELCKFLLLPKLDI